MLQEILRTVSQVLNVPPDRVGEESTADTLPEWDSIRHMDLVMALEEKFGVRFREDQIVDMMTVRSIVSALDEQLRVG